MAPLFPSLSDRLLAPILTQLFYLPPTFLLTQLFYLPPTFLPTHLLTTPPPNFPQPPGRLGNSSSICKARPNLTSPIRTRGRWIGFGLVSSTIGNVRGRSTRLLRPSRSMAPVRMPSWSSAQKRLWCVLPPRALAFLITHT